MTKLWQFFSNNRQYLYFLALSFLLSNIALISMIFESFWDRSGLFASWVVIFFFLTHVIFLSLLNILIPTQWLLYLVIVFAGFMGFYAIEYAVVFDSEMWRNVSQTNPKEAADILSFKFFLYLLIFIGLPILFIHFKKINLNSDFKDRLKSRGLIIVFSLIFILIFSWLASSLMADFLRNHKKLRYYNNPSYGIYNLGKFAYEGLTIPKEFDSGNYHIFHQDEDKVEREELIVLVIGETARYDHFSINGYGRETNPELKKVSDLISYSNFTACGTSTAVSVPCIFSLQDEEHYKAATAQFKANLLDILPHEDINVHWFDNNSDSKHVADRINYKSFKNKLTNSICDIECRDVGMISEIKKVIDPKLDNLIVLHQMGSHGPAYFKRYPKEFDKFKPACQFEDISKCSKEEIVNAYDNTILYTDYFLGELIQELKGLVDQYEVTMIYVSDHGESLGEHGAYLHGLPMTVAPEEQKHIPVFIWAPQGSSDVNYLETMRLKDNEYHHGNISDMILRLLEVGSDAYKSSETAMVVRVH